MFHLPRCSAFSRNGDSQNVRKLRLRQNMDKGKAVSVCASFLRCPALRPSARYLGWGAHEYATQARILRPRYTCKTKLLFYFWNNFAGGGTVRVRSARPDCTHFTLRTPWTSTKPPFSSLLCFSFSQIQGLKLTDEWNLFPTNLGYVKWDGWTVESSIKLPVHCCYNT